MENTKRRVLIRFMPAAALMLGACSAFVNEGGGQVGALPEAIAALAAPNQDLQSARLSPVDGCYWYVYAGPVETTLLPLRTVDGRPICAQPG